MLRALLNKTFLSMSSLMSCISLLMPGKWSVSKIVQEDVSTDGCPASSPLHVQLLLFGGIEPVKSNAFCDVRI